MHDGRAEDARIHIVDGVSQNAVVELDEQDTRPVARGAVRGRADGVGGCSRQREQGEPARQMTRSPRNACRKWVPQAVHGSERGDVACVSEGYVTREYTNTW